MKKVLIIGGLVLVVAGLTTFTVLKIKGTVKPSDYTNNRKKIKKLRRITFRRIPVKNIKIK